MVCRKKHISQVVDFDDVVTGLEYVITYQRATGVREETLMVTHKFADELRVENRSCMVYLSKRYIISIKSTSVRHPIGFMKLSL